MNREDYLRALRCLLREVTKTLKPENPGKKDKPEFNLQAFAAGLMRPFKLEQKDLQFKDKVFNSIADLVTLCIFMTISPLVRSEKKDLDQVT